MDSQKIHHFIILAKTEHIREAANLLHISHAGLSKSIRCLENELGVRLTAKNGRNIRITQEGKNLIPYFEKCLEAEKELFSSASGTQFQRPYRIGSFEVFSTYLAPHFIDVFADHKRLQFFEHIPGELEIQLASQKLDAGITYLPVPHQDIDHIKVSTITMGVFGTKKWLKRKTPISDIPFVVPNAEIGGTPTKVRGLDGWPESKVERKIFASVALLESALAIVRSGKALAYLPEFIAKLNNDLVKPEFQFFPIPLPAYLKTTQSVYALKHKASPEDISFKKICRVLRSLKQIK